MGELECHLESRQHLQKLVSDHREAQVHTAFRPVSLPCFWFENVLPMLAVKLMFERLR